MQAASFIWFFDPCVRSLGSPSSRKASSSEKFYLMAARQERIDAFIHEGSPPTDQPLEILCEDHVGTYVIPFLCQWTEGTWQNAKTRHVSKLQ